MIKKLHHSAYRCRDSEQTREFYEDFLGLPLVAAFEVGETKTGRSVRVLHTFYQLEDGSALAFFEAPDMPFMFKEQHDFDLHIALEVERAVLEPMLEKGRARGIESRGVSDHGAIHSIYFRDPSGYVIELCARIRERRLERDPRELLRAWSAAQSAASCKTSVADVDRTDQSERGAAHSCSAVRMDRSSSA